MYYVKGRGMQFIYKRSTLSSRTTESQLERLLSCTCRVMETVHRMSCCRCQRAQENLEMHPYTHSCTLRMRAQVLFENNHLLHSWKKKSRLALQLLTDDWRQFVIKSCHLSGFYAGIVTATYIFYETSWSVFICRPINI